MWRGRLFFLCLALALLSGCAPGGPVAEAGADAQLPADKLIAITFDDGPRRNTTERLLDGLQERGASATFFLIGKQIEGNEDLVRRMQAEGHQVGSHTWNHVRLQGISRETLQREVGRTEETLEALLGGGPYWLRPPYGAVDAADRELLQVPMIKWSIDPRDWEKLNTAQVKAAVLENAAPNQIILLHDIYDTSVDAALEIVDTLQGEGYRFVTVQELLDEYDGKFGNTPGCQTTEDPAQDTLFAAQQHSHYLYIDLKTTSTVSPHLFGHNLEHTRASIMDGLSAQMIRNRKFAGAAARNGVALDWEGIGECVYFANEHRLPGSNANEAYVCHYAHNGMWRRNECQSQMIQNPIPNQVSGIRQKDLFLQKDRSYPFAVVVKVQQPLDVRVALTNADGTQIYAETVFPVQPVLAKEDAQEEVDEWQRFETILTPGVDDAHAVISITYTEQAQLLIGAVSMMPDNHFHTMRRDTVEKLKEIGVRLLRWPGGNFAGEYRWQDMFLHPDRRAPMEGYMENETQPFTHGYDMHEIDTDDFIALCREIGAEPFLTINAAWDSPEVCAAWVEYCNGPAESKYGRLRAQRGHQEPYNVKWWSLGNEMGYGHMEGANTPDGYASLVETHARAMLKVTPDLKFVSSGPYPNQEWVDVSIKKLAPIAPYVSLHTYNSVHWDFTSPEGMERCYNEMIRMPIHNLGILRRLHDMLPEKTFISYDEWNLWKTWCRNPSSMEGIFTAQMLHMFMHESEKQRMPMACYFEPVNEGAMQVHPDHTELTATGQAFALLSRHAGGKLCTVDGVEDFEVVATIDDHHVLTLTMLNLNWQEETTYSLNKCGTILENKVLQAENLLPGTPFTENPLMIHVKDDIIKAKLPPRSVACISISLVE